MNFKINPKEFLSHSIILKKWGESLPKAQRSDRAISAQTGISRSRVNRLKSGAADMTVKELILLSEYHGQPADIALPKSVTLGAEHGAHVSVGNKIGAAFVSKVSEHLKEIGNSLKAQDLARFHEASQGHMYRSENLLTYLVAFSPTNHVSAQPKIVSVGKSSLAYRKICQTEDSCISTLEVEKFIRNRLNPERAKELMQGYIQVQGSGGRKWFERDLVYLSGQGEATCTTYLTLLMDGFWSTGEPVVWNFSEEIFSRPATAVELADLVGAQGAR